jgi:hypothetical protein
MKTGKILFCAPNGWPPGERNVIFAGKMSPYRGQIALPSAGDPENTVRLGSLIF